MTTATTTAPTVDGTASPATGARGIRLPLRHQLPVASPISAWALGGAALGSNARDAVTELTRLLCREYHAVEAAACESGTQALQLAIEAAWRRAGRRGSVALPAFACYDLASAAAGAGVPVGFFDLEPQTLSPDLESLERRLRAGARVVVIAPLYGIPVDWASVSELCARYGAFTIEDAAQGHGSTWQDRPLGSLGDLSVLSFGRGKGWTGGGGGAVLAREQGWLESEKHGNRLTGSRGLRPLVALALQWATGRPTLYGIPASLPFLRLGETVYNEPSAPRRMPALLAKIALRHRGIAAAAVEGRRLWADYWMRRLPEIGVGSAVTAPEGGTPGYLRFPLLLARGLAGFTSEAAARRAGIAASYPRILPELEVMHRRLAGSNERWPGARTLVRQLITLPTHHLLTNSDCHRLVEVLCAYRSDLALETV